jgi:hypothetical protein
MIRRDTGNQAANRFRYLSYARRFLLDQLHFFLVRPPFRPHFTAAEDVMSSMEPRLSAPRCQAFVTGRHYSFG